ncbi:hypothetical protein [Azovibrio restrictus]|uniref:hypothetical protein n=1 Tax=Azovibrio restrictus TaxID=146938 RepID=UPI0026E9657E|nr:hypothetical protein [Azovibrio restrictus]MDD3481755.1 hypothetical protein [Azovibrio restrictus]
MTETYDWNPMPHKVNVKCPQCGLCAEFEFAEVCRIELKADVEFFKNSTQFEYRQFQDSCGHYWHGALYYAGLHGDPRVALENLPLGYNPSAWNHSKYLYRSHGMDIGSVHCEHCHLRKKHSLNWPSDAYYAVSYKDRVLWAFNRESACDLHGFILSKTRDISKYRWSSFLLHVPTVFKTQKAREFVAKKLFRLLAGNTRQRSKNSFQETTKKLRFFSPELKR